jgi:hypothetical protein
MDNDPAKNNRELFRNLSRRMLRTDYAGRALSIISGY